MTKIKLEDKWKDKYPYIVKFGRMMLSGDSFIDRECKIAEKQNCPKNVLYFKLENGADGYWITTDDIINENIRRMLDLKPLNDSGDKNG